MIVTMVVFFALYRVIYAIPAYVPQINEIYQEVAVVAQEQQSEEALDYIVEVGKDLNITTVSWDKVDVETLKENPNYVIDAFTKFGRSNWDELSEKFANGDERKIVEDGANHIMKVNSIFGDLNLAETPQDKPFPGFIIPILCMIMQYIQTHLIMSKQKMNAQDPTMASMNMMNKVMPVMSGLISIGFPIGNGIYLASSSVFRIIQQIFVNKSMDNMDVDAEIEKNMAKAQKKREKMHLEASDGSIKNVANMKTINRSVNDIAKMNTKKEEDNNNAETKQYEKGSIASIAHMMEQGKKK